MFLGCKSLVGLAWASPLPAIRDVMAVFMRISRLGGHGLFVFVSWIAFVACSSGAGSGGAGGSSGNGGTGMGGSAGGAVKGSGGSAGGGGPLTGVVAVSAGEDFACALLSSGTVKCWGGNLDNELGNGGAQPSNTAVSVTGLSGVTAISASGGDSACALVTGGAVKCWGNNFDGQLGNGSTSNSAAPVAVTGLTGATSVSVGNSFTCAALTGGAVECWGDTSYGQNPLQSPPTAEAGVTGATAVASGADFACAMLTGGAVDCWGFDNSGQLGDGSTTYSTAPVAVTGLTGVTAVATSSNQFACAVLTGGTVDCWGNDPALASGNNGTTIMSSTPIAVAGLTGVTAISAGAAPVDVGNDGFACALLAGGTVECWGDNGEGELGNGSTAFSATPVAVTGLSGVTAISSGDGFTCAVLTGGTVECWGEGVDGTLGSGSYASSSTPVEVMAQ
jgi:alpha-tubulin suppressor-like RCC1 family protein